MVDVGHCVRIALAQRNMSVDELAKALGVGYGMAAKHKRDSRQTLRSIENLAEVFELSVPEFLALAEVREKD